MSLRFGLPVVIMSTLLASQMILNTEAQSGTVKTAQHITFDCDPGQLHGAAKLTCLVKRFEEVAASSTKRPSRATAGPASRATASRPERSRPRTRRTG